MKTSQILTVAALCAVTLFPLDSLRGQGFSDDFEGTLSQWTGLYGGPYEAAIVPDPLNSGHGNVVTFTALHNARGLIATANELSFTGPFVISFDYLGLPGLGGTAGDLGGFVGVTRSLLDPGNEGTGHIWLAGTQDDYPGPPGLVTTLIDDGAWHHYTIQSSAVPFSSFYMMFEDFAYPAGVPGDAFFDNITVTPVPEPSAVALASLGAAIALLTLRLRRGCNAA